MSVGQTGTVILKFMCTQAQSTEHGTEPSEGSTQPTTFPGSYILATENSQSSGLNRHQG